ncbi:MAG: hypothetical protein JOS17DRAFT_393557 [Linnemannia elongata]|nr:MAG: hypothetical protein JOS17DRAFT_393557 [Linnemannia elongata]
MTTQQCIIDPLSDKKKKKDRKTTKHATLLCLPFPSFLPLPNPTYSFSSTLLFGLFFFSSPHHFFLKPSLYISLLFLVPVLSVLNTFSHDENLVIARN